MWWTMVEDSYWELLGGIQEQNLLPNDGLFIYYKTKTEKKVSGQTFQQPRGLWHGRKTGCLDAAAAAVAPPPRPRDLQLELENIKYASSAVQIIKPILVHCFSVNQVFVNASN